MPRVWPLALACAVVLMAPAAAFGAGEYDASYGTDGVVTGDGVPYTNVAMRDASPTPDGKVVIIGGSNEGSWVARYSLADAKFDPSFAGTGYTIPLPGTGFNDVLALPDGRIALAGTTFHTPPGKGQSSDASVVMLRPDGSLDPSWSGDGVYRYVNPDSIGTGTTTERYASDGLEVVLDTQGRLLLGGTRNYPEAISSTTTNYSWRLMAIRLTAAGEPDPSFGDGGVAVTKPQGSFAYSDIGVAPDSGVLLSGTQLDPYHDELSVVVRFTSAGAIDTGFGQDGYVPIYGERLFPELVPQLGGVIVVSLLPAVYSPGPGNGVIELTRLTYTGAPDPTFGTNGRNDLGEGAYKGVVPRSDGSFLVVAGLTYGSNGGWFALIRPSGVTDTSLAADDTRFYPFGGFLDREGRAMFWRQVELTTGAGDPRLQLARHCLVGSCGPAAPPTNPDPDDPGGEPDDDPADPAPYRGRIAKKSRAFGNKKIVFRTAARCVRRGGSFPAELRVVRGSAKARRGPLRVKKVKYVTFRGARYFARDMRAPFRVPILSERFRGSSTIVSATILARVTDLRTGKTTRRTARLERRVTFCG